MSVLEDDDDYVPELRDEWLTPEEHQSRRQQHVQ